MRGRPELSGERIELLEERRDAVAGQLAVDDALVGNPVELDGAALAVELLVAVPGGLGAAEGEEGAAVGAHLFGVVVEVVRAPQDAQAAAVRLPAAVEVDEHGDDLGRRVGVYVAVAATGAAAHGDHGRPAFEAQVEFLLDRAAELGRLELGEERREAPAV